MQRHIAGRSRDAAVACQAAGVIDRAAVALTVEPAITRIADRHIAAVALERECPSHAVQINVAAAGLDTCAHGLALFEPHVAAAGLSLELAADPAERDLAAGCR